MESMVGWLAENWFNVLSAVGIVGGLLFTAASLRSEAETRQVGNLLILTRNHRELWSELFVRPDLARVLDPTANLATKPVTEEETVFVNLIVQHLNSVFQATKSGLTVPPEGLSRDVRGFFSLPIPRAVWARIRAFQDGVFGQFVERCLMGD